MPRTLVEKRAGNELLKQYLETHKVKIASTVDELHLHSVSDDNGEEVDDFLSLLEEWRKEGDDNGRRID